MEDSEGAKMEEDKKELLPLLLENQMKVTLEIKNEDCLTILVLLTLLCVAHQPMVGQGLLAGSWSQAQMSYGMEVNQQ